MGASKLFRTVFTLWCSYDRILLSVLKRILTTSTSGWRLVSLNEGAFAETTVTLVWYRLDGLGFEFLWYKCRVRNFDWHSWCIASLWESRGCYMFSPSKSPGKNCCSWGVVRCWVSIRSDPEADQTPVPELKSDGPEETLTPRPPHMSAPLELALEVRLALLGVLPRVGVDVTASCGPPPPEPEPSWPRMAVASPSLVMAAWMVVLPSTQLCKAFWAC